MKLNINKFSFGQLTSNTDGKTSASGTVGVLVCTIGAIAFLIGTIVKITSTNGMDIMNQAIVFTGIGVTLLGYRKGKDTNSTNTAVTSEQEVVDDAILNQKEDQPLNS